MISNSQTKNGYGHILGDFVTKSSSGHPGSGPKVYNYFHMLLIFIFIKSAPKVQKVSIFGDSAMSAKSYGFCISSCSAQNPMSPKKLPNDDYIFAGT
jgi:hypothetical protein